MLAGKLCWAGIQQRQPPSWQSSFRLPIEKKFIGRVFLCARKWLLLNNACNSSRHSLCISAWCQRMWRDSCVSSVVHPHWRYMPSIIASALCACTRHTVQHAGLCWTRCCRLNNEYYTPLARAWTGEALCAILVLQLYFVCWCRGIVEWRWTHIYGVVVSEFFLFMFSSNQMMTIVYH